MVGRPLGSGIVILDDEGAGEPTVGSGATSFCWGVLKDSISCQKPDEGGAAVALCAMLTWFGHG